MSSPTRALGLMFILFAGWSAAPAASLRGPAFDAHWHDGRAEIDGYRLVVHRYGAPRVGQGVLVYVTEPFSARLRVKLDDPTRDPGDVIDVLKLNAIRDFQTGVYDYNTMVSTFVRTDDLTPVKVSFTSTEWCGNVYEEMLLDSRRISQRVISYFEGESGAHALDRPAGGLLEDELLIRVRGLRGDWLKPGESRRVPFLESAFWRRLAHRPARWSTATVERLATRYRVEVPAGAFDVTRYVVRTADGRRGTLDVELKAPYRVVAWTWGPPRGVDPKHWLGGTDQGELTGSARLAYWKLNKLGDERYLDSLGIRATATRP